MVAKLLIFLFTTARLLLGPAACKYPVGCMDYAIQQFTQEPFFTALWHTIKRLGSCW